MIIYILYHFNLQNSELPHNVNKRENMAPYVTVHRTKAESDARGQPWIFSKRYGNIISKIISKIISSKMEFDCTTWEDTNEA